MWYSSPDGDVVLLNVQANSSGKECSGRHPPKRMAAGSQFRRVWKKRAQAELPQDQPPKARQKTALGGRFFSLVLGRV